MHTVTQQGEFMRTDEEILERIEQIKDMDWLGTQVGDLVSRLSFEKAKQFLDPEATAEQWGEPASRARDDVIAEMLAYMPFAWERSNNERGISAGRSMDHFSAWVWLAGDDLGELRNYEFYGKDNLVRICNHYGWVSSQWDDGRRVNTSE